MMLFHSRSLTTRGVTAFSAGPTLRRPPQYSTSFRPLRMVHARGAGYGAPVQNVGEMVGNTPLIKLSDQMTGTPDVTIYAKAEFTNPCSSVKDRIALSIIETAEQDGTLQPGDTVVEATSGNTGIAVAMMCAQRGYKCVITIAEPFSVERRKLMRMLGAKVIVTPKKDKGTGMVKKAEELCEKHGWFLCHQFENEANWQFHMETTGPEIINDFEAEGKTLTHWVTGYGTGGTFHGAGKKLKEKYPDLKIVLAEPEDAGLLVSGTAQDRKADGSPASSHPAFKPHPIQGWTPDFIPKVLDDSPDGLRDELLPIPAAAAISTSKAPPKGSVILAMLPDTGERYLSTPLFAEIAAD